jgi:hypothetical protein
MLKSDIVPSEFGDHAGKDGQQFIGFAQQRLDRLAGDAAIVLQQFQPQLRLVRFLKQAVKFRTEFGIRSGTRGFVQPVK